MVSTASIMRSLRLVCRADASRPPSRAWHRQSRRRPNVSRDEELKQRHQLEMKLTKQAPKPSPQEEEEEREQGVGVRMAPADIDSSRNENIQNEEDVFRAEAEIVGGDSPLSQDDLTRKSQALMEIMQAGASVEAAIARHAADIDETMLKLVAKRMEAARELERSAEVLQGLELLAHRLQAEMDRRQASASLRLLDTLLNMMDGGGEGGKGENANSNVIGVERAVRAKLRAAFGVAPLQTDVMMVATQLGTRGTEVVDTLLEDIIDPNVFMAEVSELLNKAMEQQRQLEQALTVLAQDAPERKRVEEVVSDRAVALSLVQNVVALATREINAMNTTPSQTS